MKKIEVHLDTGSGNCRVGLLEYGELRGKEVSSFELCESFLANPPMRFMGPDIGLFRGKQYPSIPAGFGMFQDAAPDSWGRKLIRRREKRGNLRESDYLLGVFDLTRLGALRFRPEGSSVFVNNDGENPAPPWTTLRTLEDSSLRFEKDDTDEAALSVLLRPGTSLGGARPKASVTAPDGSLWLAKFPSKDDECDTGRWEYLIHLLAKDAGIAVPEAALRRFSKNGSTFLCRRFDRIGSQRIHFASAMTMLGCEDRQEEGNGTYLDIAGFIMQHGVRPDEDLPELWRRIVFSLLVSNTDDHLRNHGFLLTGDGWRLSPAYDLNANAMRPRSLSLELEEGVPIESVETMLDAAEFFRVGQKEAGETLDRIRSAVGRWRDVATRIDLPRHEQEQMAVCFERE